MGSLWGPERDVAPDLQLTEAARATLAMPSQQGFDLLSQTAFTSPHLRDSATLASDQLAASLTPSLGHSSLAGTSPPSPDCNSLEAALRSASLQQPRSSSLSSRPSILCSTCAKACGAGTSHCCSSCGQHWCLGCLQSHLVRAGWLAGTLPVPCMGRAWGCTAHLPLELVQRCRSGEAGHLELSPSGSGASLPSAFSPPRPEAPLRSHSQSALPRASPRPLARLSPKQLRTLGVSPQSLARSSPGAGQDPAFANPLELLVQTMRASSAGSWPGEESVPLVQPDTGTPQSAQGPITLCNSCHRPMPEQALTCYACFPEQYPLYRTSLCSFYQQGCCKAGSACLQAHNLAELQDGLAMAATKVCTNYAETGACPHSACPFAHKLPAESRKSSSSKKVICKFWFEGRCTKGAACQFAHGTAQLRHAGAFRTSLCPHLLKGAECPNGLLCTYAHSADQLIRHPLYKTRLCKGILQHGVCHRGAACHYAHSADELRPTSG